MLLAPSFASLSESMVIPGLKKETTCYIVMSNYVVEELLLSHICIAVIHRKKKENLYRTK